jgi:cobalt-precorrin-5B (C1)-methyltransferase
MLIYASVTKNHQGLVTVEGGKGVGRVTKPGLACGIGETAINPVPRQMILSEVQGICDQFGYKEGLGVIISVPEGEEIAKRTLNPSGDHRRHFHSRNDRGRRADE